LLLLAAGVKSSCYYYQLLCQLAARERHGLLPAAAWLAWFLPAACRLGKGTRWEKRGGEARGKKVKKMRG